MKKYQFENIETKMVGIYMKIITCSVSNAKGKPETPQT